MKNNNYQNIQTEVISNHKNNVIPRLTRNPSAFTLIELLVVVLIIGILAAIAVPQYQRVVDRARATEAVTQGRALVDAQVRYYLANGKITRDLEELDIEVSDKLQWSCSANSDYCATHTVQSSGASFEISRYNSNSMSLWCKVADGKESAKKVCEKLGTLHHTSSNGYTDYYLIYRGYLY